MEKEQNILIWLTEKGFINDRSWNNLNSEERFYSLKKHNLRVEIKVDWNLKYHSYTDFVLYFLDCEKEIYLDGKGGYLGYIGQKNLCSFDRQISEKLFNELYEHYSYLTQDAKL